ncbi:ankyrin repeat domain-containing protein [Mangrovimonas aestuarii]|uniref:ankyrin repeat domain-containing protein n=1 Tax=Mangrovimonas aestuarii TaxID=3018443 RepID=UPI0023795ECA|nr:ankyrin repeat domain-containing protein [Mangrovimonas aestuarii]
MKKALVISAIALVVSYATAKATPIVQSSDNEIVTVTINDVDPFCTSIVKGDFETVKKLVERGANVNKMSNGMTPSMYAARYNRVKILKLLIDNGANLKVRGSKGYTAQEYAELSNATDAYQLIEATLQKKKN